MIRTHTFARDGQNTGRASRRRARLWILEIALGRADPTVWNQTLLLNDIPDHVGVMRPEIPTA